MQLNLDLKQYTPCEFCHMRVHIENHEMCRGCGRIGHSDHIESSGFCSNRCKEAWEERNERTRQNSSTIPF